MKDSDQSWIEQRLLERFLRYVRIDTTSDRHSKSTPTTAGQLELARVLVEELEQLSVRDVELDEGGFLFAHLESNLKGSAKQPPEIGFIAHLDTSDAAPGKDVDPRVHEKYDGKIIALKEGVV
ncbi:MAG: peptidase T, partial [Spirochaetia bacterium]